MRLRRFFKFDNYRNALLPPLHALFYDRAAFEAAEAAKFKAAGLDPAAGLARLNGVLAELGKPAFDFDRDSVHWLVFACLSLDAQVARILEIGTFTGEFTAILGRLFPGAEIVTCDVPATDPIMRATYGRGQDDAWRAFVATRAANLAGTNIRLVERNSFFLRDAVDGPFDLAWVDGGHLFPEVAWDLCNAYSLCRPGGVVLCDDVIIHPKGWHDAYISPEAHRVLEYVAVRANTPVTYFLKRLSASWSAWPVKRKFVAMLPKPAGG